MSASECPAVSIVIPVYNVEKYLRECLDSVLAQTMVNWEAICVDDGSMDTSGAILDEYAARDPRFRVIHCENGGLACARNRGLALVRAPYVCFVDSDDWIDVQMLQVMYNAVRDNDADVAVCAHCEHWECNGGLAFGATQVVPPMKHGKKERGAMAINGSVIESLSRYSWDKIFRTSVLREQNLHFEKSTEPSEDHYFVQMFLMYSKRIVILDDVLCHYRRRESSATINYVQGKDTAERYIASVATLPKIVQAFPGNMPRSDRKMWCKALFAQNFHQIYLVKHVLRGKNHPEEKSINRAVWSAFWFMFWQTPKLAVCRIMAGDAMHLLRRVVGRG